MDKHKLNIKSLIKISLSVSYQLYVRKKMGTSHIISLRTT